MDSYSTSRERFRQQDATTKKLRNELRGKGKSARKAAVALALTVPLTPTQREACKARGSVRPVSGVAK